MAKIAISDKSSVTPEMGEKKEQEKGKRKRLTTAQLNDIPPLTDGTDLEFQTHHDLDPTSSSSVDVNGKGPPKKPAGGNERGTAPSPSQPPPPT